MHPRIGVLIIQSRSNFLCQVVPVCSGAVTAMVGRGGRSGGGGRKTWWLSVKVSMQF